MTKKPKFRESGFALVITLTLMILLTILAVGLLTLSTVSLRSTGHGDSAAIAKSNARLALMLAIGQLQKTAGPDKRITAPANLVDESNQPGITGVWNSWRPPSSGLSSSAYTSAKTGNNFLGYLMSDNQFEGNPDPTKVPEGSGDLQKLVGSGSLGSAAAANSKANEINSPVIETRNGTSGRGGLAWVTLDEGVKGRIDLEPAKAPSGQGEFITAVGSPARNGFESADGMDFLSQDDEQLRVSLPKLVSLNEANLKTTDRDAVGKYFHDFTVSSNSVQTDVANGGLKTDLSVVFDGTYLSTMPVGFNGNKYLYSDGPTPFQGATSDPQWGILANYARLYRKVVANDNPKSGLKAALPGSFQKPIADKSLGIGKSRYEPNMVTLKQPVLMPTVLRVDTVFSLVSRPIHGHRTGKGGNYPYLLHMMYLPVITLHNPYNVPLRVSGLQVEFSDFPIGFDFLVNNLSTTKAGLQPMNDLYSTYNNYKGKKKQITLTTSNSLSNVTEVLMGAGETRIFGTPFAKSATWADEFAGGADGKIMFDWEGNKTQTLKTIPGMITGPNDGAGFDVDSLSGTDAQRSDQQKARDAEYLSGTDFSGLVMLKADDDIKVKFGPKIPATAAADGNIFKITIRLNGVDVGTTQVFYLNQARLDAVMREGTSPRFPEQRSFPTPEIYPRSGMSPITATSILEANSIPVSQYVKARPFAIFSVGGKTTKESFTKSRAVADTGAAFQMATCDFTTSQSQGASPLEFALVPVKSDGKALESGGKMEGGTSVQGFFFGGHGSLNGSNNATFYEIPLAPLQSIAQFRHANFGSIGSVPYVTYTVGESRAHPAVPPDATYYRPNSSRTVLDHSWLANDQLWDKYWFSTLATLQGMAYSGKEAMNIQNLSTEFFAGNKALPNCRNLGNLPAGESPTDVAAAAIAPDGKKSAAYIMTRGGFNVNSTSVPAWASVLSGLSKSDVPLASGSTEKDPLGIPFLRVRQPAAGVEGNLSDKQKLWSSYRTLDSSEITDLAGKIVDEVRARGPFLSMSEFVNRRIGSSSALTNKGAIQAALDESKLNARMEINADPVTPTDVGGFGWQNPGAVTENTGVGSPGEISQGDILTAIGSFVSVRSDTFRIRAYGDARDAKGAIIARSWCEATVQRMPEYIDATEPPEAIPTTPANVSFGRQFKIVSFRWLSPADV